MSPIMISPGDSIIMGQGGKGLRASITEEAHLFWVLKDAFFRWPWWYNRGKKMLQGTIQGPLDLEFLSAVRESEETEKQCFFRYWGSRKAQLRP
jgi:hypothetical protein